jgi:hypothetical protein
MARKFAPISPDQLHDKVNDLFTAYKKWNSEEYEEDDDTDILNSYVDPRALCAKLEDDLGKVEFDCENVSYSPGSFGDKNIIGLHALSNGLTFLGGCAGGDWEVPIYFILYWDGKKVRGYIPKKGNPWNGDTNEAFGNDEEADEKFLRKKFDIDKDDDWENYKDQYDFALILKDIEERIQPNK